MTVTVCISLYVFNVCISLYVFTVCISLYVSTVCISDNYWRGRHLITSINSSRNGIAINYLFEKWGKISYTLNVELHWINTWRTVMVISIYHLWQCTSVRFKMIYSLVSKIIKGISCTVLIVLSIIVLTKTLVYFLRYICFISVCLNGTGKYFLVVSIIKSSWNSKGTHM